MPTEMLEHQVLHIAMGSLCELIPQKKGVRAQEHMKINSTLPSPWAEDLTPVSEIAENVSFALRNVDSI